MIVIEYKKHLINGATQNPDWVVQGDFFQNPEDNTFIGVVLPEEERDYYIPDSLITLSRDAVINRCLLIHKKFPYKTPQNADDTGPMVVCSEEQIIKMVDNFFTNFVNLNNI